MMSLKIPNPFAQVNKAIHQVNRMLDLAEGKKDHCRNEEHHHHHHHCENSATRRLAQEKLALQRQEEERRRREAERDHQLAQEKLALQRQEQRQQEALAQQKCIEETLQEGQQALNDNDYSTAALKFDGVLAKDPHHIQAKVGVKKAYLALGDQYVEKGVYWDALSFYRKANAKEKMELVIQILLKPEGEQLQKADLLFESDCLQDVAQAQEMYGEIERRLQEIRSQINNSLALGVKFDLKAKMKIAQEKCKKLEMKGRAAQEMREADEAFIPLSKELYSVLGTTQQEAFFSSRPVVSEYLSRLRLIKDKYKAAHELDPTCAQSEKFRELHSLRTQLKDMEKKLEVQELKGDLLGGWQKFSLYSFQKANHLEAICENCETWLKTFDRLTQLASAECGEFVNQRLDVEAFQRTANFAKMRLENLFDTLLSAANEFLEKQDPVGFFSEKTQNSFLRELEAVVCKEEYMRDKWVSLSPNGLQEVRKKLCDWISSLLMKNYWCGCFCPHEYKLRSHTLLSEVTVVDWLDEALQRPEIHRLLPPPYELSSEEFATPSEGDGGGLQVGSAALRSFLLKSMNSS